MEDFNNTINQLDPINIYRTPYNNCRLHILFKCTWNIHHITASHLVFLTPGSHSLQFHFAYYQQNYVSKALAYFMFQATSLL